MALVEKFSTTKTLTIKVSEILYDASTLMLPFLSEYRPPKDADGNKKYITAIKFEKEVTRDGQPCVAELIVKGDPILGVPTMKSQEVMIALERIFVEENSVNGELQLKTDVNEVTVQDRTIDFKSITNLARMMGYKGSINNRVRQNILDDIERLANTTWICNVGWTVNEKDLTLHQSFKDGFRLINRATVLQQKEVDKNGNTIENSLKATTKIVLSEQVYTAIANKNVIIFNKRINEKIKNLAAKNIYLVGKKWAGKDKVITMHLSKLKTVIPTVRDDKHTREYMINTLVELKKTNECGVYFLDNDVITLDYRKTNVKTLDGALKKSDDDKISYFRNKYNTWKECMDGVKKIGLTDVEMPYLDPLRMNYIAALLRYIESRQFAAEKNNKHGIDNPDDFFRSYYLNNYKIDDKYFTNK